LIKTFRYQLDELLYQEIEGLRKELETVKTKLNELEQANNADSVLNSNSMKMELDQKDEYIVKLTKQVSELKLVNEENNNLIKNLENKIKKLTGDVKVFRNNFKLADAQYETVLKERDLKETDLLSQIEFYRNRIALLESWLNIVFVEDDITDSDTDSPYL
ncbi:21578_t:CDS:2, partial [Gigaspora margarita]